MIIKVIKVSKWKKKLKKPKKPKNVPTSDYPYQRQLSAQAKKEPENNRQEISFMTLYGRECCDETKEHFIDALKESLNKDELAGLTDWDDEDEENWSIFQAVFQGFFQSIQVMPCPDFIRMLEYETLGENVWVPAIVEFMKTKIAPQLQIAATQTENVMVNYLSSIIVPLCTDALRFFDKCYTQKTAQGPSKHEWWSNLIHTQGRDYDVPVE